jgi:microcin C transport system substrate-binding protein
MKRIVPIALHLYCALILAVPSPRAIQGDLKIAWQNFPSSVLHYIAFDEFSYGVTTLVWESLLDQDKTTLELRPRLAKKWKLSDDKKIIRVEIDPRARFSDGKPVTSDDVLFTWKLLLEGGDLTTIFRRDLKSLGECVKTGPLTIEFRTTHPHFKNLEKLTGFFVLPKHSIGEKGIAQWPEGSYLGSGPYKIETIKRDEGVVLRRDPQYWANTLFPDRYRLERITFRVAADPRIQLEMLKTGEIDYLYVLSSKTWEVDTTKKPFTTSSFVRMEVPTQLPFSTVGIAWNMRRPPFDNAKVRQALSLLFPRERILKDLMFDSYLPASGIFHIRSMFHSPENVPVPYDLTKAVALLKSSRWDASSTEKQPIEILTSNPAAERYLTLYQESLAKAGIRVRVRVADWVTVQDLIKRREFQGVEIARERELNPSNLGQMWGSEEAQMSGSQNLTGFADPKADELLKKIDTTWNKKRRAKLLRELDQLIGSHYPMTFLWEQKAIRILFRNLYDYPGKGYEPYAAWNEIFHTWSWDKTKAANWRLDKPPLRP